jgi:hypothetical protein
MTRDRPLLTASMPRWLGTIVKVVAWLLIAALGLIAAGFIASFAFLLILVVGHELGLWGPPFGGE